MRKVFCLVFSLCILGCPTPSSLGDWGAADCGPVGPCVPSGVYQWEQCPTNDDIIGLRMNGVQIGAVSKETGVYWPYDRATDTWGKPCKSPAAIPDGVAKPRASGCGCCDGCSCEDGACPCKLGKEPCCPDCKCLLARENKITQENKPAVDSAKFPGVIVEEIGKSKRHTINGREVTRRELVEALTTVPDDRKTLSLTFCGGSEDERKAALENAKSAGLAEKVLVQSYPADNPLVRDAGFVTSGHPSVYLQAPSGLVLCRADKGDMATMESIRDKAKDYDPSNDPTPGGFSLAELEKWAANIPGWVWFAAVFLVLLIWHNKGVQK